MATSKSKYKVCSVDGCNNPYHSRGYCQIHYWYCYYKKVGSSPRQRTECSIEGCSERCRSQGLCNKHYQKMLYETKPEMIKKINLKHYHEKQKVDPEYKKARSSYGRKYRKENDYDRKYYLENKSRKINRYMERIKNDKDFALKECIRKRFQSAIKHGLQYPERRAGSAVRDLGCSIPKLKQWLESQFYPHPETGEEMTWDNHGRYGWHIDHIIPLSAFDLSDSAQVKKACHWFNLRPLWEFENISRSNNVDLWIDYKEISNGDTEE